MRTKSRTQPKAKSAKRMAIKDLTPKDAKSVRGGRKAGKGQQEFLVVKMVDVLITSVNPSGAGDS